MRAPDVNVRGSGHEPLRDEMALPDRRLHAPSRWIAVDRLHPLVPRHTKRFRALYCEAVEREFGRLKHEWALLPLRVRRIECVRLHANLSILTKLAVRLDKERGAKETHGVASAA